MRVRRFGNKLNSRLRMKTAKRDYYEVLGVPRDADDEEISKAFRALARELHPDVADAPDAEEQFRELAEAYSVLSKPQRRLLYDRFGWRGRGHDLAEDLLAAAAAATHEGGNDLVTEVELGY